MRVLTDDEVRGVFDDPRPFLQDDGTVSPGWERFAIVHAALPAPLQLLGNRALKVTRIRCHQRLAPIFRAVYVELYQCAAAWSSIGDFGGCYEWRLQRGTRDRLSRHCWGIAVDQDCADNPFGHAPEVEPDVVRIFKAHGFAWGGDFPRSRRDGMHFEFADLARLPG